MQKEEQKQQASTKNLRIRDFFYHLVVYLFILAILLVVTGSSQAVVLLLVFWGFAVALHGVYAYFG